SESSSDFSDYLKSQQKIISDRLSRLFSAPLSKIEEAACYSLLLPSKRLRPILCLEICRAYSNDQNLAWAPALAVEMVHTYSLIHDELPAMDNDELRRGMPTSHVKYGEARAILAGDGLLTKAFEVLA